MFFFKLNRELSYFAIISRITHTLKENGFGVGDLTQSNSHIHVWSECMPWSSIWFASEGYWYIYSASHTYKHIRQWYQLVWPICSGVVIITRARVSHIHSHLSNWKCTSFDHVWGFEFWEFPIFPWVDRNFLWGDARKTGFCCRKMWFFLLKSRKIESNTQNLSKNVEKKMICHTKTQFPLKILISPMESKNTSVNKTLLWMYSLVVAHMYTWQHQKSSHSSNCTVFVFDVDVSWKRRTIY